MSKKWTPEPCYEERAANIKLCEKIEKLEELVKKQLLAFGEERKLVIKFRKALEEIAEPPLERTWEETVYEQVRIAEQALKQEK